MNMDSDQAINVLDVLNAIHDDLAQELERISNLQDLVSSAIEAEKREQDFMVYLRGPFTIL